MTPQEIEQIIDMLAEKLGPIGGQVWSIYVRQVYVSIVVSVLWAVLFLAVGIVGMVAGILIQRRLKRDRAASKDPQGHWENYFDPTLYYSSIATAYGLGGTGLVLAALALSECVKLLNPEYYAIQMLLGR